MRNTAKTDKEKALSAAERIYGALPERPLHLSCENESLDPSFAAGKATLYQAKLLMDLGDREISMPIVYAIPKSENPLPAIIYLNYKNEIPNKFLPAEEIIDRGYAIFSFCVDDVSDNSPNFKSGITKHISGSRRKKLSPGKIALWAWAALRVVEYASDLEAIDKEKIILAGHGILARAALLASGNSEKSWYVIANCVSENPIPFSKKCSKSGLTVRDFSYLYSPAFVDEPNASELDTLLELTADKTLLLGFAEDSDGVLTPKGQKEIPAAPFYTAEKKFSYHIRRGCDYFSREDWNIYLDFIDKKD